MSLVKNRIKPLKINQVVICTILFSALIIGLRAENLPHNIKDKVRILILSKHIRLLKEGKTDVLNLSLPKIGEIDTGSKRIPCRTLSISRNNNSYLIKNGNSSIVNSNLIIFPNGKDDIFSITINGEIRIYPLPLYIKNNGNEIELSIEENVNQFAIDAALGELGDKSEKNTEALYAIAHLIKARCSIPSLTNKHKGYDFCDLTCCQTYKGKSGLVFDDPVSINTTGLMRGFFFHTSGGGKLFTESVFNGNESTTEAPKDIIYSENFILSSNNYRKWEASISEQELKEILYHDKNIFLKNIYFNSGREMILLETGTGKEKLSPETFRLKINRVRGWNFIKSNNYNLTKNNGIYKFTGSGLGHGAGLSFEGAVQLAQRGYSRYEILEHYYPDILYNTPSVDVHNRLQYIIFSCESGEIIKSSSGISLKNRIIPCGSIFKLFIALYLAENRKDLFYNYTYNCADSKIAKEKNNILPRYCWNKNGHGKMNFSNALYNSCNKYFASLYNKIDPEHFKKWLADFTQKNGINLIIPEIKSSSGFANILAGLNFNVTITIDGIIKLNRYIYMENKENYSEEISVIFDALHKTFTDGTAKETEDSSETTHLSSPHNKNINDLWGKTGTVIAGTNSHHGYGIFTGGINSTGIVSLLRKGTGAMAARESKKILLDPARTGF